MRRQRLFSWVGEDAPAPRIRMRRQHVALRGRRREQISKRVRAGVVRGALLLSGTALGFVAFLHSDSWFKRTLREHTPEIVVDAPPQMAGLPVTASLPPALWSLWIPGVPMWTEHRIERRFSELAGARIENHFERNRVTLHLLPRRPLARWNGQGVDDHGVVFPLAPGVDPSLPTLFTLREAPVPALGPWLEGLSRVSWLWSDLDSIKEDALGHWMLTLRSGAVFLWGPPDSIVAPKINALAKALADAKARHGGATRADLRFFDEGRIIISVRRSGAWRN